MGASAARGTRCPAGVPALVNADCSTLYETWVRTLRAWSKDPLVDLSRLPSLDAQSFPPAAYQRFLLHLNAAIDAFMENWQTTFMATMGAAHDDHSRARALVSARTGLARRLSLARHPSFPPQIRDQMIQQTERDVRSLQAQLETDALRASTGWSASTRSQQEALLRLVRRNALTAVLEPSFSLAELIDDSELRRAQAAAATIIAQTADEVVEHQTGRPKRRIFIEDPGD